MLLIQWNIFPFVSARSIVQIQLQPLPLSLKRKVPTNILRIMVFPLDSKFALELIPVALNCSKKTLLEVSPVDSILELKDDLVWNEREVQE